jgi:hypothetical protein
MFICQVKFLLYKQERSPSDSMMTFCAYVCILEICEEEKKKRKPNFNLCKSNEREREKRMSTMQKKIFVK